MKKLLLLLALVPLVSMAQEPVVAKFKAICWPYKEFIEQIEDFKEEPIILGLKDIKRELPSFYSILHNKDTGNFTIVQFDENIGCILGVGKNMKFNINGLQKEDVK